MKDLSNMDVLPKLQDNMYRALFEQTNDAVFLIGLDLKYINVNQQAARMLGYTREELVGKNVHEVTSLEEIQDSDASSSGIDTIDTIYERVLIRKDGSKVPVEVSTAIVYNSDGNPSHIQSTIRDISSRKDYEQRLKASEARNKAIVEALPDVIFRLDFSGKIIDFSAGHNHKLPIPTTELIGWNIQGIWPEEVSTLLSSEILKVAKTKEVRIAKIHFPNQEETFEVRLNPVSHQEIFAIFRDISEWVLLEQMKSDFINRASHELRTPLTTSILMTNLIDDGGPEEEIREFWKVLKHELNRQKILVDRLLMAGRLESNTLAIDLGPIDLKPVIEESVAAVSPIANKQSVFIETIIPDGLPKVRGDVSALQQVFINLLNNAIKFSPEGSTVSCAVELEEKQILTTIIDQGIGIPSEEIQNLFSRFFRTKNVKVAEIPGSGIGLFIVKSIVDELEGEIHVESDIGEGSRFLIRLNID